LRSISKPEERIVVAAVCDEGSFNVDDRLKQEKLPFWLMKSLISGKSFATLALISFKI